MSEKSTPDRQSIRERAEKSRSRAKAARADGKLRELGRHGSSAGGRALFEENAETLSVALGALLETLIEDPGRAGPHYSAWPLLLAATTRGPRAVASLALEEVINRLPEAREKRSLARSIGTALQNEMRAGRIEGKDADLARLISRRCGKRALSRPEVLSALRLDREGWCRSDREELGGMVLEVILSATSVARAEVRGRRTVVVGTESALKTLRFSGPPPPTARGAMLCPPRPWSGMHGGGHLANTEPLVRSRAGLDLSHLAPDTMGTLIQAVNHLQQQQMRVTDMVALQRVAWEGGWGFSVRSQPIEPPAPLGRGATAEAMARWRLDKARAQQDAREGAPLRAAIEKGLAEAEALAGETVWQAHCADFRGRIYTASRSLTHQGPDWEKASLEFAAAEPVDGAEVPWLMRAVAGHWGIRGTWLDRDSWCAENIELVMRVATDPLDTRETWAKAKDPWQFVQAAKGLTAWFNNPTTPLGTPVRFDQCCSGAAIVAALVGDARLARLTNLIGTGKEDLYGHLAELLISRLQDDLQMGSGRQQRMAEAWLQTGIDRSSLKGPTMAALYGGSWIGLVDILALQLAETRPANLAEWASAHVNPARYLAGHLRALFREELASVARLREWLQKTSRLVLTRGFPLAWTSPSGMAIRLGQAHDARSSVVTASAGRRRWRQIEDHADEGELSARATSASLLPNVVHSFDGAFCQLVVCRAAERGIPLATNHDCFATTPAHAGRLHGLLLDLTREIYGAGDHLARMAGEIAAGAMLQGGVRSLPPVPKGLTLCRSRVGENPHHFC